MLLMLFSWAVVTVRSNWYLWFSSWIYLLGPNPNCQQSSGDEESDLKKSAILVEPFACAFPYSLIVFRHLECRVLLMLRVEKHQIKGTMRRPRYSEDWMCWGLFWQTWTIQLVATASCNVTCVWNEDRPLKCDFSSDWWHSEIREMRLS